MQDDGAVTTDGHRAVHQKWTVERELEPLTT